MTVKRLSDGHRAQAEYQLLSALSTSVLRNCSFDELCQSLSEAVQDFFGAKAVSIHANDERYPESLTLTGATSCFWQNRCPKLNELRKLTLRQSGSLFQLNYGQLVDSFPGRFEYSPQLPNNQEALPLNYLGLPLGIREPLRRTSLDLTTLGPRSYALDAVLELFFDGPKCTLDLSDLEFLKVVANLVEISLSNWTLYSQLEERRAFTEVILNGMADGLLMVDSAGSIVSCNDSAAKLLGWKQDELTSSTVVEVLGLESPDQLPFNDLAQGRTRQTEIQCNLRRGRRQLAFQLTRPTSVDSLSRSMWILVFRDVSQQREMEELRNDFIAMMSHELRTPLTGMKGYLKMLMHRKARDFDMDKIQGLVTIINHQADQLQRLIADLMDAAKLRNEALDIQLQPTDLVPLLYEVSSEEQFRSFALSVVTPTSAIANVDPEKLTEVLRQLLSNAAKYSIPGGNIELNCKVVQNRSPRIEIEVKDEGVGIPAEQLDRVFDMFHRVDNSNARVQYGLGLGLFLSKKILESHGGTIYAASQPGCGSTFTISIPT
jgi:PAS domain S-box-containing protein